jgi:hypothetical protein
MLLARATPSDPGVADESATVVITDDSISRMRVVDAAAGAVVLLIPRHSAREESGADATELRSYDRGVSPAARRLDPS